VNAVQPELLAPSANFQIGGKQYAVALHIDGTYVLPPGSIPGETILMYGIGFGNVTPSILAGQIVCPEPVGAATHSAVRQRTLNVAVRRPGANCPVFSVTP